MNDGSRAHGWLSTRGHASSWRVAIPVLAVCSGACDARVNEFVASPQYVCAGQPVHLTWNVTGSATLTATPPAAGLRDGPVDGEGQATIAPTASTYVELHVTRFLGSPTSATQEIRVQSAPTKPEPLSVSLADPSAGCDDTAVRGTVHVKGFAPTVTTATVSARAGDRRSYRVTHAGKVGTIRPGDPPSTQWSGTPLLGDWVLDSPLDTGETCGPSLPPSLGIDVFAACTPGSP